MRVMHWWEKADVFCGFTLLPSGAIDAGFILVMSQTRLDR